MKKTLLTAAILLVAFGSSATLLAASESAMENCFKKHVQLMDKPALKNMWDCWRVHGYKMERS